MKRYFQSMALLLAVMLLLPCLATAPDEKAPPPETENAAKEPGTEEAFVSVRLLQPDGTVDTLPLEDYIVGVVLGEMPASYEGEALKAQAVAARTYTVTRLAHPAHEEADLCASASCCAAFVAPEAYTGGEEALIKVQDSVASTASEILTYDGEPIVAAFHAMSAGKTEDAANVWGSDVPYLKPVESIKEAAEENFETTVTLSFDDFLSRIKSSYPEVAITSPSDIGDPVYDASGYVQSITFGSLSLSGPAVRSLFSLRSAAFRIQSDEQTVTFIVHGYGHGVGLSQHGANLMAREGYSYRDILQTYYTGVSLSSLS